ncbi:MAG TPA: GGDEF domain-containing protein [Euzebya sp.]|nr:GGDEF domain-containing protein [Euzebya sp.]
MIQDPAAVPPEESTYDLTGRGTEAEQGPVRRAYLVLLAIPFAFVIVLWVRNGTPDPYTQVLYPTILVGHGLLLAGLLSRRLTSQSAGPWVIAFPAATLVGRFLTWELHTASRPENPALLIVALGWFGVVFTLAFLVFGTRRGSLIAMAGFASVYLGAVGSVVAGGMMTELGTREVVGMAGANAALIAIVWVLTRNVGLLTSARARADLLALQATTDPLTGISNRRRLDDDLRQLLNTARRYDHPLSVILVDLDHFKDVNDTYGHDIGDAVLIATVDRMGDTIRQADILGRWGGEEFLIIAPHTDLPAATAQAERCRGALAAAPVIYNGVVVPVTASFGVTALHPDDDARILIRRADLAMYTAKSEGRDRVVTIADAIAPAPPDGAQPDTGDSRHV